MKQTLFSHNLFREKSEGFTLLEMLVSLSLFSIIGAMVSGSLVFQSDIYLTDIGRVRVQQNLRVASDIVSMNIRQAGEGLDEFFPAIVLTSGTTLTVRRKIISDVLSVCQAVSAGNTQIYVSDSASVEVDCIPANIATSLGVWSAYRSSGSGPLSIYIFDRVSGVGEFLDYSAEGTSGGSDYLSVNAVTNAYPINSTSVYILEEFSFSLDTSTNTLQLIIDDDASSVQDVAYKITQFQVSLEMQDGSVLTSLSPSDPQNWKDIRSVNYTLTGVESWKTKSVTQSFNGEYFPRNIMSS